MHIDFSKVNINEQMLILRTNDGTPLGALGYANNISAELCYNEVSTLSFVIPKYTDNKKTPHYDNVIGMRIIDLKDIGQFILSNPKTVNDGIRELKECTAYSLEYEFTFKTIFLENSTYNFWNPLAQGGSLLRIIMDRMPSWSIGTVDTDLIGKYRTFDVDNENIYNFIKSTVQETYQCVFEFDTYNRKVNIRSVNSDVITEPVYFSLDNLIKEIEVEEDSESIVTCLDVSGADGVDIRSVNPMGINKIYDLSHFMNTTNVSQEFINKYNAWKAAFDSYQRPYYNLSVGHALKNTELLTEKAALADLNGDKRKLENQLAVEFQAHNQGMERQSQINSINSQILAKNTEVNLKNTVIRAIEIQLSELLSQMVAINKETALSVFFSSEELLTFDKFIKEESIAESTFVAPAVKNYNAQDVSSKIASTPFTITNSKISRVTNSFNKVMYSITGGFMSVTAGASISAEMIKGSYEVGTDNKALFTAYLKSGAVNGEFFDTGCVSLTGTVSSTVSNTTPDATFPEIHNGTLLTFTVADGQFFFTRNTTLYEQRAVEWDLYDFGRDCLGKLSTPTYTFNVSMADFLFLDEFTSFKNSVKLGNKVYLRVDDWVLEPIAVKCSVNFENPDDFSFEFSNAYKALNSEFKIADLLNQSISMGHKLNSNQFSFNQWVESGAQTSVSDFMKSAIDTSVNEIMSSSGQAPTLNDTGLRIRKLLDNGEYSPKQLWANNNSIMMTSNNWASAEIAIGEFYDPNCGNVWGVIAPMIVGTILAGNNLVIESAKQYGGVSVFKVDADGAKLINSPFDLYSSAGRISLNTNTGIAGGNNQSTGLINNAGNAVMSVSGGRTYNRVNDISESDILAGNNNLPRANFWLDMYGDLYLRGSIYADRGVFRGDVYANNGYFRGVVQASDFLNPSGRSMLSTNSGSGYKFDADFLDLKGISITDTAGRNSFSVNRNGFVTIGNGSNQITYNNSTGVLSVSGSINMGSGSSINWSAVGSDPATTAAQNAANSAWNLANTANTNANNAINTANITQTYIDGTRVMSPRIEGGDVYGTTIRWPNGSLSGGTTMQGNQVVRLQSNVGVAIEGSGVGTRISGGSIYLQPGYPTPNSGISIVNGIITLYGVVNVEGSLFVNGRPI